ncbi:MAG: N-acetylornithine carbamoyltransferase [Flavobacteriaceae bacterium]|nr:N-acetylornithine carbamoyltransferase [Flavobacteriaceae bacterium]
MKQFLTLDDLTSFDAQVKLAQKIKADPYQFETIGKRKTLGLLFFNPSLRTRLSTQKAGRLLGMDVMVMNFSNEAWAIEYENETIMEGLRSEHVKEAAQVVSQYCDVVGIRAFATLTDKDKDESEQVLQRFIEHATVPILNMESATAHPLQALADALTLSELSLPAKPKVVLTWAPHPKALPHAVGNSFTRMMQHLDADFIIANPKGYDLDPRITKNIPVIHNQDEALKDADVVYAKNWSSYEQYGQILRTDNTWMLTPEKMKLTNNAAFMHCLPIRRNVVVSDGVLDHPTSKVIEQANNRTYAAAAVLKNLLS